MSLPPLLLVLAALTLPSLPLQAEGFLPRAPYPVTKPITHEKVSNALQAALQPAAPAGLLAGVVTRSSGTLQIYVRYGPRLHTEQQAQEHLASLGMQVEVVNPELRLAQGWVTREGVQRLADDEAVEGVELPRYARPKAGGVTTEGDEIIRAPALRQAGLSGSGVRVGTISDGADHLFSAQASLDLPQEIEIIRNSGAGDEGTAMLEIVHDIAPEARLGFCGAQTSLEFIACIGALRETFGARIIVEDLGFPAEPYFEDGPVARAATAAAEAGVLFISAAGNDALRHYQAPFMPSQELGFDDRGQTLSEHNFGLAAGQPSDPTMSISVAPGQTAQVILQWNDPFGRSGNDYDLFLLDDTGDIVARSEFEQAGRQDPLEVVFFANNTDRTQRLHIAVIKFSGEDRILEFFVYDAVVNQYAVAEDSIWGQSAAEKVMAVATVNARLPDRIAPYSSRGPTLISFPETTLRATPTITGVDGVQVTGAGGFPSRFFGTSAAAPHVAAAAALLLEAFPALTADQLRSVLMESAVDLGPEGFDFTYGAGRLDALRAYNVASGVPIETGSTNDPGNSRSDDGGGCFVATAAYGSFLHPHVQALREFRDHRLLTHPAGRWLVVWYEQLSPPVAEAIRHRPWARGITRAVLAPVVYAVVYPVEALLLTLGALFSLVAVWRESRARFSSI